MPRHAIFPGTVGLLPMRGVALGVGVVEEVVPFSTSSITGENVVLDVRDVADCHHGVGFLVAMLGRFLPKEL